MNTFTHSERLMRSAKSARRVSLSRENVEAIIVALYEKYEREERHSQRVAKLVKLVGKRLALSRQEVEELELAGLFHDIGKVSIDCSIVNKPGKLTAKEYTVIQGHAEVGYRVLSSVKDLANIAEYVLAHHERWDGKGYPRGLKQEEIPIQSRIIAVVDAFDAMISDRPYRKSLSISTAKSELAINAGSQFDPTVVAAFNSVLQEQEPEFGVVSE